MRLKRLGRLFLLSVGSVVLTLLVFEIIVRLIPLYPSQFSVYHATTGWRYKPNFSGNHLNVLCLWDYNNHTTTNERGFHDVAWDTTTPKPRILLLGDSVLAGLEVPLNDNIARRMQAILTDYTLYNTGVAGYGTSNQLLVFREMVDEIDPEVVILFFESGNDVLNNGILPDDPLARYIPRFELVDGSLKLIERDPDINPEEVSNPPNLTLHDWLNDFSVLYRLLAQRIAFASIPKATNVTKTMNAGYPITRALLAQLAQETRERGIAFGIVVNPASSLYPLEVDVKRWVIEQLDELAIPYISLSPIFDAGTGLRFVCDRHWTSAGHAAAAPVVADFIRELAAQYQPQ